MYLYCQQDWWQVGPGADVLLGNHVTCGCLHSVVIFSLDLNIVAGLVPFSSFHIFLQVAGSHFCAFHSVVAFFLLGQFAWVCPLVSQCEQYGPSGQSFFRCPGCPQQKHKRPSGPTFLTPFPSADFSTFGSCVLGTALFCCASAAGMKGWAHGLNVCLNGEGSPGCFLGWPCGLTIGCINCG